MVDLEAEASVEADSVEVSEAEALEAVVLQAGGDEWFIRLFVDLMKKRLIRSSNQHIKKSTDQQINNDEINHSNY